MHLGNPDLHPPGVLFMAVGACGGRVGYYAPFSHPEGIHMLNIGRFNRLKIKTLQEYGLQLVDDEGTQVFLPRNSAPANALPGDELEVFVYVGMDNVLAAMTEKPLAQAGECAWLKAVSISSVGAFLHWGVPKDLLLPFAEQTHPVQVGRFQLVYIYLDNSGRIAASSKLNRFIQDLAEGLSDRDPVSLMISDRTDLGVKAIVNDRFWGLLYYDDILTPVHKGQRLKGFIKRVREDGKLELTLQQPGYAKVGGIAEKILERLEASGGYLPLNDKSPPEVIYNIFAVSKGAFKQAIGALFKQRSITIDKDGIRLVP